MTATETYDDGNTKNITGSVSWSSDNAAVFTVSHSGLITANHAGTASVKATSATISDSTTVSVTVGNLSSITITPTNATITSSETQQYTATGTLDNGSQVEITNSVTWSSSNKRATISSSGLATAQGTGTTYIVAISGSITSNTTTLNVD
jgi:trimeric autotransporter adhesin